VEAEEDNQVGRDPAEIMDRGEVLELGIATRRIAAEDEIGLPRIDTDVL
jgi:hypothetical protein